MFWILGLFGIILLFIHKLTRGKAVWLVVLFVCSFLAVSVGLYYRMHYFLLVLPALCLLVGGFISQVRTSLPNKTLYQGIPILIFLVLFGGAVYNHRVFFFTLSPRELDSRMYPGNPFKEAEAVARYIRENSAPDAKVAVLGSEPEIYFLSNRRSATGYIYTYGLMEPQPFALEMQKEMIREIETAKPEYIVMVNVPYSWVMQPNSDRYILNWSSDYLAANYVAVGLVDYPEGRVNEFWGSEASTKAPTGDSFMVLFRRKSI